MLLTNSLVNRSPVLSSADSSSPLTLVLVARARAVTAGPVAIAPERPLAATLAHHKGAGDAADSDSVCKQCGVAGLSATPLCTAAVCPCPAVGKPGMPCSNMLLKERHAQISLSSTNPPAIESIQPCADGCGGVDCLRRHPVKCAVVFNLCRHVVQTKEL